MTALDPVLHFLSALLILFVNYLLEVVLYFNISLFSLGWLLIGQAFIPTILSLQKKKGLNVGCVLLQSFEIGANMIEVVLWMHADVGSVEVDQACVGVPAGHFN